MTDYTQPTFGEQQSKSPDWYAEHPKRLYWGQLTNADATLYAGLTAQTYPPQPKVRIDTIWLCNTDTVARTVTLEIRSGASAASTRILSAYSIAGSTAVLMTELGIIMEAGELISGLADTTAKVNVRISGAELLTGQTA